MSDRMRDSDRGSSEFEKQALTAGRSGPLAEFRYFLTRTGKWWMLPIIASLLGVGVLIVLGSTAVAPLIYALF